MLNLISSLSKASAFCSKVFTLGNIGFNLKRWWSSKKAYNVIYPAVYFLQFSTSSLAIASLFDLVSLSPTVISTMVSATSLFAAYISLYDVHYVHEETQAEHNKIEKQLTISDTHLRNHITLIEDLFQNTKQIQYLNEEISVLQNVQLDLEKAQYLTINEKRDRLYEIYLLLKEKYKEKALRRVVIHTFFKDLNIEKFSFNTALGMINGMILETQEQTLKVKKLKNHLAFLEQKLITLGIIHTQLFKYKIIIDEISQLNKQLNQKSQVYKEERAYLKLRKDRLQNNLTHLSKIIVPNLKFRNYKTVYALITQDPNLFTYKLKESLNEYITIQKNQIQILKKYINIIEPYTLTLRKEQIIQHDFETVEKKYHLLTDIKDKLSINRFNAKTSKINANFNTTIFSLSFLLCLSPNHDHFVMIKSLILGLGFLNSTLNLKNFIQKNLLVKKNEIQYSRKIKKIDKEIEFKKSIHQQKIPSEQVIPILYNFGLQQNMPLQTEKKIGQEIKYINLDSKLSII